MYFFLKRGFFKELTSLVVDWILPKLALSGPLDHLLKAAPRNLIR